MLRAGAKGSKEMLCNLNGRRRADWQVPVRQCLGARLTCSPNILCCVSLLHKLRGHHSRAERAVNGHRGLPEPHTCSAAQTARADLRLTKADGRRRPGGAGACVAQFGCSRPCGVMQRLRANRPGFEPPTPRDSAHACRSSSCEHPSGRVAPAPSEYPPPIRANESRMNGGANGTWRAC